MKKTLLAALLMSIASSAMAVEQSVINISGKITLVACEIDAADLTKTVNLTSVGVDALTAGNYAPTYFSFTFSKCDLGYTKVTANVTGTTDDSDASGYGTGKVLKNTGNATGVAVALLGKTSTTGATATGELAVGEDSKEAPLAADGNGTSGGQLTLGAQIVPIMVATPATAGSVVSTATINFTYS